MTTRTKQISAYKIVMKTAAYVWLFFFGFEYVFAYVWNQPKEEEYSEGKKALGILYGRSCAFFFLSLLLPFPYVLLFEAKQYFLLLFLISYYLFLFDIHYTHLKVCINKKGRWTADWSTEQQPNKRQPDQRQCHSKTHTYKQIERNTRHQWNGLLGWIEYRREKKTAPSTRDRTYRSYTTNPSKNVEQRAVKS